MRTWLKNVGQRKDVAQPTACRTFSSALMPQCPAIH